MSSTSTSRFRRWRFKVKWGERTKSLLCILGLALLPFVLFWEMATFREIPLVGDVLSYNYPIQHLIFQQIKTGHVPLWNNRMFSGIPLLAQAQTGALYPLNLLFVLMPTWMTMAYSLLIHLSLAGVFTYLYARGLLIGRKGAVVAGVTFMFCGFTMAHLGHLTMVRTVPWLPLILWAMEQWRQRFELKYVGLGALSTGLLFLAGHPQIPVYALGVATSYIIYFTLFSKLSFNWKIALGGGVIIGLGLLLASPQVWGLYEAARFFKRSIPPTVKYEFFTSFSLPPLGLLHLIFPCLFKRDLNLIEMMGYPGILPWALAVLAAFHWRHKARGFLLLTASISFLLVLGKYTPLYRLMYHVPVYNAFRAPPRNWFEFDFALAVLAGAGFDRLISAQNAVACRLSRWSRGLAVVLILLDSLIVIAAVWLFPGPVQQILARNDVTTLTDRAVWLPLVMILASSLVMFIITYRPARSYSGMLVVGLIIADLYFFFAAPLVASLSTRRSPAEVFDYRPRSIDFLKQDASLFRVLTYLPTPRLQPDEGYNLLSPNLNILFDIDSADGYEALVPFQYLAFSDSTLSGSGPLFIPPRLFRPDHNTILSLLNVKYVLVPLNYDLGASDYLVADGITLNAFPYPVLELGTPSGLLSATLDLPAYPVTTLAIASFTSDGAALTDGQQVARVTVTDQAGQVSTYYLSVGQDTAELAYDCDPTAMSHQKAPLAYAVPQDASCTYNVYLARLELGTKPVALRQVTLEHLLEVGQFNVDKVTLYNAQTGASYPVSVAQGYLAYFSRGDAYRPVYEDEYTRIYQNTRVLPRAFLVPQVEYVDSAEEANQIVHQGVFPDGREFEPTEVALVEAASPLLWPNSARRNGGGQAEAKVVSAQAGRMEVQISTDRDAFLVYSENYFPGWSARVSGQPTKVYRTDGTLLGILVPAGEHRVVLTYRPVSLYLAWVGYGVALLIVVGLVIDLRRSSGCPIRVMLKDLNHILH